MDIWHQFLNFPGPGYQFISVSSVSIASEKPPICICFYTLFNDYVMNFEIYGHGSFGPYSRSCIPLLIGKITAYYEKTICQVFNCLLHNHCCSSRYRMFRGHFRHRSKGGGSLNVTPRHALQTIFLSFYSQRLLKSLQETLPAVF